MLERRYLKRDENNLVVETPARMFARVARAVAEAEAPYVSTGRVGRIAARFFDMMAALDFLPNSPALMNAGRELGQLSACFVLPVEDSIESIFNAVRDTALIHKSGGGTGFSFSAIRPARDVVKSTRGVSSGPLSFMNVFDVATETIKQGGARRGANMGLLSVHHPDILDFIEVKEKNPLRFANFNLSVSITDRFMEAVFEGRPYELVNPHTRVSTTGPPAAEVFDRIVRAAWACGDPGLVFIDRINQTNPLPALGPIEATNPCGEQPLLPYESCTLGSINLARFVRRGRVDFDRLRSTVRLAVRFLDNVIDANLYPLPQVRDMTLKNRKIGLGVMGLADMLIQLGLAYESEEALDACEGVMGFIQSESKKASADLARRRGSFSHFDLSVYPDQGRRFMRNATTTTIAPTGTLSIIAGCTSGIEPPFALAYRRRFLDNQEIIETHPLFKRIAQKRGFWSDDLARSLLRTGRVSDLKAVPADVRRLFVTAHEIDPLWHVRIQAAFQKHTDNAVSKTVNLRRQAGLETVRDVFVAAYRSGLKGVTVYRDGCKQGQVLVYGPAWEPGAEHPARAEANHCPDCGGPLEPEDGCRRCRACGYSVCH